MSRLVSQGSSPSLRMAALMLCAGSTCAVAQPWDPARAEALAEWVWMMPMSFDLPGARLRMRQFRAPLSPVDAARQLTEAGASRFERIQFSGAVLSLSGTHEGRHWLAQLRPSGAGRADTIGLLSSLGPDHRRTAGFDPATLAPPGAKPVLRASSRIAGGSGLLASYLCPGSYPRVAAAVLRALRARRWRPVTTATDGASATARDRAASAAGEWMRPDGARLTVHLYARADEVVLTFWHRPKESP